MTRALIINFTWDVTDKANPQPRLLLADLTSGLILRNLKVNDVISGMISDEMGCIGHEKDKGQYVPCPTQSLPQKGHVRCQSCFREDFFSCRAYCTGRQCLPSSLRARQLCIPSETFVYLTAVGDVVKVGVSLNPLKRWLDQGSLFATVVYRAPGLEARRIENEVASFLNVSKTVTFSSKLRSLPSLDLENARDRLVSIVKQLERFNKYEEYRLPDSEIHDLTPNYGEFVSIRHLPQEIMLNQEFSGIIKGFLGKMVLLENNKTYFVLNLKKFVGHWCDLGSELKSMKGQQSLNAFFA